MNFQHQELAAGRWREFTFAEQMGNIGSEIERAINWKKKENAAFSQMAFERALELLYLTIDDPRNRRRLRELVRLKEVLLDSFMGENQYRSTDEQWRKYFLFFAYAARKRY